MVTGLWPHQLLSGFNEIYQVFTGYFVVCSDLNFNYRG